MTKLIKMFFAFFLTIFFTMIALTTVQLYQSEKLVRVYGRIAAKAAMSDFQDEKEMEMYSDDSGAMSISYDDYLNWLSSSGTYGHIGTYLYDNFTEGVTPINFSLPYLDKEKLEDSYNAYLNTQMDALQDDGENNIYSIDNVVGRVSVMTREIKNFNTSGYMFGMGSSFKDNVSGHTRLFDYDQYISYFVVYEIDYDLSFNVPMVRNMIGNSAQRTAEFSLVYELFN